MAKVAGLLGNTDDSKQLEKLGEQIKADFNKAYYDPAKKTYWQGRQGADVFALAFGLVPQENYKDVFDALLNHLAQLNYHFDTGILATPLLLKVLSQNNRDDVAYKIMDQRSNPGFAYLLDDKNSMLWEEWNGGGSHAHPMFGSVVSWFYSALGGIKPGDAGLQHFTIEPKPMADLNWCKTSYNSPYGKIRSEWKTGSSGSLEVLIEVPTNTSASFVLPGDKKTARNETGKTMLVESVNGENVIRLQSGIYRFKVL